LQIDNARLPNIEIIEDVSPRSNLPSRFSGVVLLPCELGFISQELFELLDCQPGITDDGGHRLRIDRIISRNDNSQLSFRHEYVLTLAIDLETGFLERFHRAQMIYAGKLRH